jgi:predicted membrane protein (TIGR00267 family)
VHVVLAPFRRRWLGPESIREIVFGVEDGVVQNMTLIAGMVGATMSGGVIVLAGVVNAVAGVLSMSMGTFLSSQAERDALTATGVESVVRRSPIRDAVVMAAAYGVGAVVPLLPFTIPMMSRTAAVIAAVTLTAVGLFALGALKGALSKQARLRTGAQLLLLASAAGLAGYLIGAMARSVFNLSA